MNSCRRRGRRSSAGLKRFAERLAYLSELVGADLNLIKMDMGGVPREEYVEMVELLGSVIPLLNVRRRRGRGERLTVTLHRSGRGPLKASESSI